MSCAIQTGEAFLQRLRERHPDRADRLTRRAVPWKGLASDRAHNDFAWWQRHKIDRTMLIEFAFQPDTTDDLRSHRANSFVWPAASSVQMSLQHGAQFLQHVKTSDRILGAVIRDSIVHWFVEFAGGRERAPWVLTRERDCRDEFVRVWADFCSQRAAANHPLPHNLTHPQQQHEFWWRVEGDAERLSMQYHVTSVAFELVQLRLLMLQFREYVEDLARHRAQQGEPDLLLCHMVQERRLQSNGTFQSMSVMQHAICYEAYQPGYVLCSPGSHAPGARKPLVPFVWRGRDFGNDSGPVPWSRTRENVLMHQLLNAHPHSSLPIVPKRRRHDTMSRLVVPEDGTESYHNTDSDDDMAAMEVVEDGADPVVPEAPATTEPLVTTLTFPRDVEARLALAAAHTDRTEMSKMATQAVHHVLQLVLGMQMTVLMACHRSCQHAGVPSIRGRLCLLPDAQGCVVCPCACSTATTAAVAGAVSATVLDQRGPSAAVPDRKWFSAHTTRGINFTVTAEHVSLYCPMQGQTSRRVKHGLGKLFEHISFGESHGQAAIPLPGGHPVSRIHHPAQRKRRRRDSELHDGSEDGPQERVSLASLQQDYLSAPPEIRKQLQEGHRKYFGRDLNEMTPSDVEDDLDPLPRGGLATVDTSSGSSEDDDSGDSGDDESDDSEDDGSSRRDGSSDGSRASDTSGECAKPELEPTYARDRRYDQDVADALAQAKEAVRRKFGDRCLIVDGKRIVDSQDDAVVNRFILDYFFERKLVLLKAAQGLGKSWLLDRAVRQFVKQFPDARILWISNRCMYAKSTHRRLQDLQRHVASLGCSFEFACYLDEKWEAVRREAINRRKKNGRPTTGDEPSAFPNALSSPPATIGEQSLAICSLESIERLSLTSDGSPPKPYDLVILDELEELRYNFHSDTMKHRRTRVFPILRDLLNQASHIWAADADLDLSDENVGGVRFLETLIGEKSQSFFLIWNTRQTIRRNYFFHERKEACIQALIERLKQGRRVVVVTNAKATADMLAHHCANHPDLQAQFASGVLTMRVLTGETCTEEKMRFMEQKALWQVNLLVYSPVISSGVDYSVPAYTRPWFDEAFLFAVDCSSTMRQIFQQLNRVRELRRGRVHVFLDVTPQKWQSLPTTLPDIRADVDAKLARSEWRGLEAHPLDRTYDSMHRGFRLVERGDSYNEVYLINQLEVNRSRGRFEALLKQQMVSAGGKLFNIAWPYAREVADRIKKDREVVKQQKAQAIADAPQWTREQAESVQRCARSRQPPPPDAYAALKKFELNDLYCHPAAFNAAFVATYGSDTVVGQFKRLQRQAHAREGPAGLRDELVAEIRNNRERKEHLLRPATSIEDTEILLRAGGFVTWFGGSARDHGPDGRAQNPAPSAALTDGAMPHPAHGGGTRVEQAVGDVFSLVRVDHATIVRRFELGTASRADLWPQLQRVQAFQSATRAQQQENLQQYVKARQQLLQQLPAGQAGSVREDHPDLAGHEAHRSPEQWSGAMVTKVLLRALRQHLRSEFHITIKRRNGPRMYRCDRSSNAERTAADVESDASSSELGMDSSDGTEAGAASSHGAGHTRRQIVGRAVHLELDRSFWKPVEAALRPTRSDLAERSAPGAVAADQWAPETVPAATAASTAATPGPIVIGVAPERALKQSATAVAAAVVALPATVVAARQVAMPTREGKRRKLMPTMACTPALPLADAPLPAIAVTGVAATPAAARHTGWSMHATVAESSAVTVAMAVDEASTRMVPVARPASYPATALAASTAWIADPPTVARVCAAIVIPPRWGTPAFAQYICGSGRLP